MWLADAVSALSRASSPADLLSLVTQRAASLDGVASATIVPAATAGFSGGERIAIEPDVVAPSSLVIVAHTRQMLSSEARSALGIICRFAASRLDVLSLAPGAVPVPPRSREIAADEMRASILALTRDLPGVVFRCKNEPERPMEFISDACLAFLGHPAARFLSRSVDLSDLIVPDDRVRVWSAIQDALHRHEAYEVSYRFVAASGEMHWAHERGRGLVDGDGEVFAIAGIILDDTARRRAEESVLRAERDLHEAHARLELTLDAADVGFWEYDVTTGIASHSNSWKRQLGLENEPLAAVASTFADRLHPDDRERALSQGAQLLDGTIERVDGEYRLLHRDGSYRTILNRGAAFRDASGKVVGLRGVHIDVSNRRAAEEATRRVHELAEQNRAVQTASRLKSEFLANMSHELRTPLNTIIGFAEVLLDNKVGELEEAHREFVGDILASGRHLLALINDVLDLSKVEAGKMEFHPVEIDLVELFTEVRSIVRELAARKRIRLTAEVESGLSHVRLDPGRLKQVLYNYLSNAIKFTPGGGSVCLRARREGDSEVLFEVEDTGPGIPPEKLGLLFVEFQQLDAGSTRQHGGTGLGLALTRRLVTAQGGRVGVRSAVGEGSAFFAVLPRESTSSGLIDSMAPAPPLMSVKPGAPTLLVVEDSPDDRTWLVNALLTAGYAVQTAASVEGALKLARGAHFDAITVDLMLPDGDGLSLVQQLRQEGLQSNVPVVMISIASTGESATGLLVHDALVKPVVPSELIDCLTRLGVHAPGRRRVLVIDDDVALSREVSRVLADNGFDVRCISTGAEGIEAAIAEPPAAIVLDLLLPDVNGFDVLERLRSNDGCKLTPIIVWTSTTLEPSERARLHSAHRVIDKSATRTTTLVRVIDDLLRGRSTPPPEGLQP